MFVYLRSTPYVLKTIDMDNTVLYCTLLFARYHAKFIPWGHKTADFVALGFQDSDEDEDEDDHEWE